MTDAEPDPGVPDLVPARMVNEFSYCPRLFFLEWVNAQFADNTDTIDGRWVHRATDSPSGRAPLPEEGEVRIARSVQLSSAELGLVAKIDLLEGAPDGTVVPVETKRGAPPDNADRSWEPERAQVCVQALLLRAHGYVVDQAILYFAETRERVVVLIEEELIARTLALVADLREVATAPVPPPPLVDSPKCPRCSLVGICLPDETNALSSRATMPRRRLIPTDDAPKPLYVTEQGAWITKSKGRIEISRKGAPLASVRLIDVSQVCIYGNAQVSTQLLRELMARDVPVCWFSYGGWFSGMASGLPGRNVEIRRRQVIIASQGGATIAAQVVAGKILNSRTLLRRNARRDVSATVAQLKSLADKARRGPGASSLLGIEGTAARLFFSQFSAMLRPDKQLPGSPFSFDGRNRRPPLDAVNCLLSYLYGLVVKDLTAVLFAIGLDPYIGFYHRPRFGRPALALDLSEEFRPLIAESVTINVINNGEVSGNDFLVRAGGVSLTASGRKTVLSAYERRLSATIRHPVFGYEISYRRALEVQGRMLAAHLLNEIPLYTPFTTR
jgi:CRISPR-associated protein Cas1